MKTELFGYVSGGYARIVERFAEALNEAECSCDSGNRCEACTWQDAAFEYGQVKD